LKLYQEFKRAQAHIKGMWSISPVMFSREYLMTKEAVFYPPKSATASALARAAAKVTGELEKFLKPVVAVKNEIIHLKEKIEEVFKRLSEKPEGFKKMHTGRSRGELVILFLAILHLIKEQLISADQSGQFGEIEIARKEEGV
jgi:chromatin segregation and condensation protein Rec8/ScpA/Scc1 (kleisin family)